MNKPTHENPVKMARLAARLSMEELARRTGLSVRTVVRIEKGENVPRGSTQRAIADALACPVDDLFGELVA